MAWPSIAHIVSRHCAGRAIPIIRVAMSPTKTRLAVFDDLLAMLALYRHLNADDPVPSDEAARSAWRELLSQTNSKVLVMEANGEIAATCTVTIIPSLTRGARPYAIIENVVTLPEYRKTGLGSAIVKAAIDAAWAANCYKISLTTGSRRESTLRFYEKLGFQKNGRTLFDMRRV